MKRKKLALDIGFVPLARSVLRRCELASTDKVMLMAIIDEAFLIEPQDGICRASNKDLGDAVGGLAVRSVIDSIARLEASGLIHRMMVNKNNRIGIEVLYDRFGGASVGCAADRTEGMRSDAHIEEPGYASKRTPGMRQNAHRVCVKTHTPHSNNINNLKTPSSTGVSSPSDSIEESTENPVLDQPEPTPEVGTLPGTVSHLIAWTSTLTDDTKVAKGIPTWVALVQARLPQFADAAIDWVQDAVLKAVDKCDGLDDEKGGASAYALACLTRWIAAGGRPHVEILQAQARADEDQGRAGREKAAADKAEADKAAAMEAAMEAEREAASKARWARLPAREKDPIEKAVIEANPSFRKYPSMIEALCIKAMEVRHG